MQEHLQKILGVVDVYGEPPLTEVEVYELSEIHPDARNKFYTRIKREWYTKVFIATGVLYGVEYAVFSLDILWVYLLPVLPVLSIGHKLKWERKTNYGALAAAKLVEPRDWPTWKRRTNIEEERKKIKQANNIQEK
jgi:hypothetical protein